MKYVNQAEEYRYNELLKEMDNIYSVIGKIQVEICKIKEKMVV